MFGDNYKDDLSIFEIHDCFLCGAEMLEEVVVKVHPLTAGAAVLCIDGGGDTRSRASETYEENRGSYWVANTATKVL